MRSSYSWDDRRNTLSLILDLFQNLGSIVAGIKMESGRVFIYFANNGSNASNYYYEECTVDAQ